MIKRMIFFVFFCFSSMIISANTLVGERLLVTFDPYGRRNEVRIENIHSKYIINLMMNRVTRNIFDIRQMTNVQGGNRLGTAALDNVEFLNIIARFLSGQVHRDEQIWQEKAYEIANLILDYMNITNNQNINTNTPFVGERLLITFDPYGRINEVRIENVYSKYNISLMMNRVTRNIFDIRQMTNVQGGNILGTAALDNVEFLNIIARFLTGQVHRDEQVWQEKAYEIANLILDYMNITNNQNINTNTPFVGERLLITFDPYGRRNEVRIENVYSKYNVSLEMVRVAGNVFDIRQMTGVQGGNRLGTAALDNVEFLNILARFFSGLVHWDEQVWQENAYEIASIILNYMNPVIN